MRSHVMTIIGSTAVIPREYAGFGLDIQRLFAAAQRAHPCPGHMSHMPAYAHQAPMPSLCVHGNSELSLSGLDECITRVDPANPEVTAVLLIVLHHQVV